MKYQKTQQFQLKPPNKYPLYQIIILYDLLQSKQLLLDHIFKYKVTNQLLSQSLFIYKNGKSGPLQLIKNQKNLLEWKEKTSFSKTLSIGTTISTKTKLNVKYKSCTHKSSQSQSTGFFSKLKQSFKMFFKKDKKYKKVKKGKKDNESFSNKKKYKRQKYLAQRQKYKITIRHLQQFLDQCKFLKQENEKHLKKDFPIRRNIISQRSINPKDKSSFSHFHFKIFRSMQIFQKLAKENNIQTIDFEDKPKTKRKTVIKTQFSPVKNFNMADPDIKLITTSNKAQVPHYKQNKYNLKISTNKLKKNKSNYQLTQSVPNYKQKFIKSNLKIITSPLRKESYNTPLRKNSAPITKFTRKLNYITPLNQNYKYQFPQSAHFYNLKKYAEFRNQRKYSLITPQFVID